MITVNEWFKRQGTTTMEPKMTGVNKIANVKVEALSLPAMRACAEDFGMKVAIELIEVESPLDAVAVAIASFFADPANNFGGETFAECETCGGSSPLESCSCCPFCGESDDEGDANAEVKHTAAPEMMAAREAPQKKEASTMQTTNGVSAKAQLQQAKEEAEMAKTIAAAEKAAAKEKLAAEKAAGKAAAAEAKKVAAKPAPKPSTATVDTVVHAKAEMVVASDARIVSTSMLDASVREVHRLKGESAASMWKLGCEIKKIYDQQLWKLRTEGGKAKWSGVEPFFVTELGMTPKNAYSLMEIAAVFTESEVFKFGTSKLSLLLIAPEEDRERLKAAMEGGTSTRKLKKEVKKAREARGSKARPRRDTGTVRADGGNTRGKPRNSELTVATVKGRQKIKLYKRPATLRGVDMDTLPRATKIKDGPIGRLELQNGVIQIFSVQESAAGELELIIETRRE